MGLMIVAVQSKVCTIFKHSNMGIMSSNPTLAWTYVLCCPSTDTGLVSGQFPIQVGLPNIYKYDSKPRK
jgi:hypothetical protein